MFFRVVRCAQGRGQIRRIVAQYTQNISTGDNGGVFADTVFVLDKPLDSVVDAGQSWMQVMPFRGRNWFVANTYRDVGAVQFYGIGLEQIVANNIGERMGGFLSWGQWRGQQRISTACSLD